MRDTISTSGNSQANPHESLAHRVSDELMVKAYKEAASMSVFCQDHPLVGLRPRLAAHGVVTAKDLRRIPSNTRVRVTGILVIVHTPPTRSGKRVMFITMEDETGLLDVVAFPKAQAGFARTILTSEVLTVEGTLQRQGKKGLSISIVMEKLILPLTGPLSKFLPQPNTDPN
ncbi:MAG: hypothetical protein FJY85_05090 [Deltaproteobacteria bacterium]|nr:hypothetical protein [Deltaproteobacteria bacterium]